jgi:hypothetical protein
MEIENGPAIRDGDSNAVSSYKELLLKVEYTDVLHMRSATPSKQYRRGYHTINEK